MINQGYHLVLTLYNFLDFFHLLIAILKLEPQTWLHAVAGYLLPKRNVSKEWVRVSANIIITSFMAFSANSFRNSFTYILSSKKKRKRRNVWLLVTILLLLISVKCCNYQDCPTCCVNRWKRCQEINEYYEEVSSSCHWLNIIIVPWQIDSVQQ